MRRGLRVRLVTDDRAVRYSGLFSEGMLDVVPSETVRSKNPLALARTGFMLAAGTVTAINLVRRLKPAAMIGFGGYPTLPPLVAARLMGVPTLIHDSNAVLGRANRFLGGARRCDRHLAARRVRSRSGAGLEIDADRHAAQARGARPPLPSRIARRA